MEKIGVLYELKDFKARRGAGDVHINHLRDECVLATANLRQAITAHYRGEEDLSREVANAVADAVSRAIPGNRPKRGTTLGGDQALAAAYDEALAEMRRAVLILGPSYLWKDPVIVEMEQALKDKG